MSVEEQLEMGQHIKERIKKNILLNGNYGSIYRPPVTKRRLSQKDQIPKIPTEFKSNYHE